MRKITKLLIVAALILALCACVPDFSNDKADTGALWEMLDGVWVYTADDGTQYFASFSVEDKVPFYSSGIMFSGFMFGGPVSDVVKTGDAYTFVLNVPAAEPTEMDDGHEAYSADVSMTYLPDVDEKSIHITNIANDGAVCTFVYAGATLGEAGNIYPEPTGMTQDELWAALDGIWAYSDGGMLRFIYFSVESGEPVFSMGTLFSGDLLSGTANTYTDFPEERTAVFSVYCPATDIGGSSYPERTFDTRVSYTSYQSGIIEATNYNGTGMTTYWRVADDFAGVNDIGWDGIMALVS